MLDAAHVAVTTVVMVVVPVVIVETDVAILFCNSACATVWLRGVCEQFATCLVTVAFVVL